MCNSVWGGILPRILSIELYGSVWYTIYVNMQQTFYYLLYKEIVMENQNFDVNLDDNDLDVEGLLKTNSRKYSPLLYRIVVIVLFVLQMLNLFGATNNTERFLSITLIILLIAFKRIHGKIGKFINTMYICLLLIIMVVSTITQKPFMGIFSNDNPIKFYDQFANGFYEHSIGNYQEAMDIYEKIKPNVPEDELLNYYMWYYDAACCAEDGEMIVQIKEEITNKIISPTSQEAEVIFKLLPVRLLIYDINQNNFQGLLQDIKPYENANEEMYILCEILAHCYQEDKSNKNIEKLFLKLENCDDNFKNYDFLKEQLLCLIIDALYEDTPEIAIVALAELYARNHAEFFESYIWCYPKGYNVGNLRWISMNYIRDLQDIFITGWNQIQKASSLYPIYREKILNFGLYIGVTDIIQEIESKKIDLTKIESTLKSYSKKASVYNILQIENKKYIFTVLVATSMDDDDWVEQVELYTIDFGSDDVAKPIRIDGRPLHESVAMGKLFLLEYSGIPGKYVCVKICGTDEHLSLALLDLNKKTYTKLKNEEGVYHCGNFIFDRDTKSCKWEFEINNSFDANMAIKVGGNINATIDYDNLKIKTKTSYLDPALKFYVEERNEQLIFPLANLNRLGGREIKDKTLLDLIRSNKIPYYQYSNIQGTIRYWSDCYLPNISGITVSYSFREGDFSDYKYFFLVKRQSEDLKLLGIYRVTEKGIKTVY